MKTVKPLDYIMFEGKPARIQGMIDDPSVIVELLETECPCCGRNEVLNMGVNSPWFQDGAEKIETLEEK